MSCIGKPKHKIFINTEYNKLKNGEIEDLNNSEFYEVIFDYKKNKYYTIWETNDVDRFLLRNGNILFFNKKEELNEFCIENNIVIENSVLYNFDKIDANNCSDYLNKWNIIDDLSKSVGMKFIGDCNGYTNLYSKFVYGSNIPSLNTSEEKYVPSFSKEELLEIQSIKNDMIRILKAALDIV